MLAQNTFLPKVKELILKAETLQDFVNYKEELKDNETQYSIISFICVYNSAYSGVDILKEIKNDFLEHDIFKTYKEEELQGRDLLDLVSRGIIAGEPQFNFKNVQDFYRDIINQFHLFHLCVVTVQIINQIESNSKISKNEKSILDKIIDKCQAYLTQSRENNTIFNEDILEPIIKQWEEAFIELQNKFNEFLIIDI